MKNDLRTEIKSMELDESQEADLFGELITAAKELGMYDKDLGHYEAWEDIYVDFDKPRPIRSFSVGDVSETEVEWRFPLKPDQTPEETGEDAEPSFSIYMTRSTVFHSWDLDPTAKNIQYPEWYAEFMAGL